MKLTSFILIAACLHVYAEGDSQSNITLSVKNAPLVKVLKELKRQSGYTVFYKDQLMQTSRPVNVELKNVTLDNALTAIFKNQLLTFEIIGNKIITIKEKPKEVTVYSAKTDANNLPPPFEIHGKIVNEKNEPVEGASVIIKGTKTGTSTNANGEFVLNVTSSDAVLLISGTSIENLEVKVGKESNLNLTATSRINTLNEIQVVGYGTQRKKDVTGSVSTINSESIAQRPVTNPLDALSSKVAGLNIASNSGAPGGQFQINIRGISSINGGTSPLIVIDGVIDANLQLLNPNDIERVDVLKDASSTAIYGVRGSNGVIIVTTKRPKNGFNLNYTGSVTIGKLTHEPKMVDANGFVEWFDRAWAYDSSRGSVSEVYAQYPDLFNSDGSPKYNVDWNKAVLQNSVTQRHYVSVTGGTEKSKQSFSLGYQNDKGLLINTYYKNYTARFSQETILTDWITLGGSLGYSTNSGNTLNGSTTWSSQILREAGEYYPIIPVKYPDGTYGKNADFQGYWPVGNPVYQLKEASDIVKRDQLLGNVYASLKLLPGLQFRSSFSTNISSFTEQVNASRDINLDLGYTGISGAKTVYWQYDNFLTYNKTFKSIHRLDVTLGSTVSQTNTNGYGLSVTNTQGNILSYYNIAANAIDPTLERINSSYLKATTNSYFGRFNYSLLDKYLLTFTGRYDGSSVFGTGNKYAFFPSCALGWIISNEAFLKGNNLISFLKLRASYGTTGNSAIAPYSTLGFVNLTTIFLNNQAVPTAIPNTLANPSLEWERTNESDIGIDLRLFNDRIIFTGDVFKKVTNDLLLNKPISVVSGYGNILTNVGSMQNLGLELSLSADVIKNSDWTLNIGGIFSANKNKVLQLSDNNQDIYGGTTALGYAPLVFRVGQPVGSFWAVHRVGTWGTKEADEAALYGAKPGDAKYLDVNNDHVINNADAAIRGNMFPKYTAAFSVNLKYKSWQLNVEIQVVHGNKIFNGSSIVYEDWAGYYGRGYLSILKDAWTPEHQNTMVRQIRLATDPNFFQTLTGNIDDRWLEDGSFIRGRNINLSYSFPQSWYSRLHIKGLSVYANVQNFFLVTKYRGFDPEVGNTLDQSIFGQGIGWQGYPRPRTYTFGVNFNL